MLTSLSSSAIMVRNVGPPELKEIVHQKPTNTNDTKAVQCERNVRCEWWWRNSPRLRLQAAALKREF